MSEHALPVWAVIPATGVGSRMQADRPKQYLHLGTSTILELTLDRLMSHSAIEGVVLVLNEHDECWGELKYQAQKPLLICTGGEERFHSVFNGLGQLSKHLDSDALVLIHDAVRPFVSHQDIERVIAAARSGDDGAILAVAVADTLKYADENGRIKETRSRSSLWRAFTPQVFRLQLIMAALDEVIQGKLDITDDASAMELKGYRPELVACDHRNFKITRPEDLQLAELFLASEQ